jgi:hypothetical protein
MIFFAFSGSSGGIVLLHQPSMVSNSSGSSSHSHSSSEDHVWFEDRWMVASLCDE